MSPSHGRGSCERPPGEVETPQRPPEEFKTSQLSLGEVKKTQRPPGMGETSRCSLEEVEAETPPLDLRDTPRLSLGNNVEEAFIVQQEHLFDMGILLQLIFQFGLYN